MTYQEAIDFLYQLRQFGTKLGLENTFRLAELCGNPHERLRFIHVAGTNGKGSTCAMLESIYRHAGLKTGLFTSPHLVSFTERIQVNRRLMPREDVVRLVDKLLGLITENNRTSPAPLHPTFFEFVTAMGLLFFEEQKCDLILWEVGMGGRLDSTNIVTPLASVITNIQLDHQRWLGDTLEQIAFEKAGIIKPGVPVICGEGSGPARHVIARVATEKNAPIHFASTETIPEMDHYKLSLAGAHQRLNAAVALKTVQILQNAWPVTSDAIREGLEHTQWAGRLQLLSRPGGKRVLLDGAHNVDGVRTLRQALEQLFPNEPRTLIIGMFSDKAWSQMAAEIVPLARRVLISPVQSQRTASTSELAAACHQINPSAEVLECHDVRHAIKLAAADPFTVITGSLHFIGEVMEVLGIESGLGDNERGLNEYSANQPI